MSQSVVLSMLLRPLCFLSLGAGISSTRGGGRGRSCSPSSVSFDSSGLPRSSIEGTSIATWLVARRRRQRRGQTSLLLSLSGGSSGSRETVDIQLDFVEGKEVGDNVVPAPAPTDGRIDIVVDKNAIRQLDLSAAHVVLRKFVHQIGDNATPSADAKELLERRIGFVINYERDDPFDPRELSEMPDIRLWFVRLDATYPWLPIALDWRAGELSRYAAMLVPHQMSNRQGLVFNPEALELFAMGKLFLLDQWLRVVGVAKPRNKLNDMMKMLGFSVTEELYMLIEQYPPP